MKAFFLTLLCSFEGAFLLSAEIREWTSAEGKTLKAELIAFDSKQVTIKRESDGRAFTLPLDKLSEADRKWLIEDGASALERAAEAALNASDNPYKELINGEWTRHEEKGLRFRFFAEGRLFASKDTLYPLVIDLHGRNGDVMTPEKPWSPHSFARSENYRERPCFILAPQAPKENETWSGANGKAVIEIAEAMLKHLPIDPDRIYLTGYSMGAYGTFHLLATEPKFFAAAVPIAGGGNPSKVRGHRKVPVWVFHGAKDDIVDVEQSRQMVDAMKKARAEVTYTELPDGDHGIGGQVYQDPKVHEWLFAQRRS